MGAPAPSAELLSDSARQGIDTGPTDAPGPRRCPFRSPPTTSSQPSSRLRTVARPPRPRARPSRPSPRRLPRANPPDSHVRVLAAAARRHRGDSRHFGRTTDRDGRAALGRRADFARRAAQDEAGASESLPPSGSQPVGASTGEDRRRTGDLPSRPMAYTGRTGSSSSSRRSASQLDPGTVLYSRYEIVKRIGGGGMGAVYYAKDQQPRRRPARRQGDDPDAPRRVAAREGRRRLHARVDAADLARTPFDPDHLRLLLRRGGRRASTSS